MTRPTISIFTLPLLAFLTIGCNSYQPYVTPERLDEGLIVVLTGIEGRGMINGEIARGLDAGGVDCAIEIYDWTSWMGPMVSLMDQTKNRRTALLLAQRLEAYQKAHPGKPIVLVGQSGGGAIAVWTAESSKAGLLDGVILLNVSLSRRYNLRPALSQVTRGIVNVHSSNDWAFLGVGTTLAGTMDGLHETSAGKEGFTVFTPAPKIYDKLIEIGWSQEMIASGNFGDHITGAGAWFVKKYVAPWVLKTSWTAAEKEASSQE